MNCLRCLEREVSSSCQKWKLCASCYKYLIQYLPYRIKAFDIIGWSCKCCGETNIFLLVADHINADNKIKTGKGTDLQSPYLYRRIMQVPNAKEHYQTLCWACNNSKKRGNRCKLNHSLKTRDDLIIWYKSFNFPPMKGRYIVEL